MTNSNASSIPDFSEAGAALLQQLHALAAWDMWAIGRLRPEGEYVVLQATDNPWDIAPGTCMDWQGSLCRQMTEGAPAVVPDVTRVPAYADLPLTASYGIEAFVGAPILDTDGQVFGTVFGVNAIPRQIDDVAVQALHLGAALMGTILDLEQRLSGTSTRAAEAEMQASHDPLTGLLNRRGFMAAADVAERHALAHGNKPAILVLDVNGLKFVNDTQGHGQGDKLLLTVASLLRSSTPPDATVARVGGDEFLVLIDDCGQQTVDTLCDAVASAMALAGVKVSLGAAARRTGESVTDLIARADQSMYEDKRSQGHNASNRLVVAPSPATTWLKQGMIEGCHSPQRSIELLLDLARAFLDLDVLFIGHWHDGSRTMEYVSAADPLRGQLTSVSQPLEETYCQGIVGGQIPCAISDAQTEQSVAGISMTHDMHIGAHVGTPLHLPDGSLYGTICGASFRPDATINDRDAAFLGFLTEIIGNDLARVNAEKQREVLLSDALRKMLDSGEPRVVLQPVRELHGGAIMGFEALSRFSDTSAPTDTWFNRAVEIGLDEEFELRAVRTSLELLPGLPDGTYLAINISPGLVSSPRLLEALKAVDGTRVVLELTEHTPLLHGDVVEQLIPLREQGVQIAVDDAGSGYSGLQRLLRVQPDIIKIDKSIVQGVADDSARQAMIRALREFGRATEARLVAEGIEDVVDRDALRVLGVRYGQGHALGHPLDPDDWLTTNPLRTTVSAQN